MSPELAGEIAVVVEADIQRDLRERKSRVLQQAARVHHPHLDMIVPRRGLERQPELPLQLPFGKPGQLRQAGKVQRLAVVLLQRLRHRGEFQIRLDRRALPFVAADGAAQPRQPAAEVEDRQLVRDEPFRLPRRVRKQLDKPQQRASCPENCQIVLQIFLRQPWRKDLPVPQSDDLPFIPEAAAFHEGGISRHEPCLLILREEERARQVIEEMPELPRRHRLHPLGTQGFSIHLSGSYKDFPESYKLPRPRHD